MSPLTRVPGAAGRIIQLPRIIILSVMRHLFFFFKVGWLHFTFWEKKCQAGGAQSSRMTTVDSALESFFIEGTETSKERFES